MASKKKAAPAKKSAAKKAAPAAKPAKPAAAKPATKPAPTPAAKGKASSTADLKRLLLDRKSAAKPAIAFTLDEVREIAKKNEQQAESAAKHAKNGKPGTAKHSTLTADLDKPHKPHHVKTASLADILGFNPTKGRRPSLELDEDKVPEKFRRYYKLLIELRNHVLTQLGEHTEETLLKSSKDDSGDLSGYGQHMADAGTDTFDRDFALSLVSSEQEALSEIEAAIKRIHDGTYGICEVTQKPIAKERLLAVPFTRYSTEAKREVERHSHRSVERGGLFGDSSEEDGGKLSDGGDDE
jgi:RNA polymerase-binding transcription factor DksA